LKNLQGGSGRCCPGFDPQLGKDSLGMLGNGARACPEDNGNLAVAFALNNPPKDLIRSSAAEKRCKSQVRKSGIL